MEDLPVGSEIVLKVVETEKEQCNGCFFDEICNNIYENVCGDFDCSGRAAPVLWLLPETILATDWEEV